MSKPVIRSLESLVYKLSGPNYATTRKLIARYGNNADRRHKGSADSFFADRIEVQTNRISVVSVSVDPVVVDRALSLGYLKVTDSDKYDQTYIYSGATPLPTVTPVVLTDTQFNILVNFAAFGFLHCEYSGYTFRTSRDEGVRPTLAPYIHGGSFQTMLGAHLIDFDTELIDAERPAPSSYPAMGYLTRITRRGIDSINEFARRHNVPGWDKRAEAATEVLDAARKRYAESAAPVLDGARVVWGANPYFALEFFSDGGDLTVKPAVTMPTVTVYEEARIVSKLWDRAAAILGSHTESARMLMLVENGGE